MQRKFDSTLSYRLIDSTNEMQTVVPMWNKVLCVCLCLLVGFTEIRCNPLSNQLTESTVNVSTTSLVSTTTGSSETVITYRKNSIEHGYEHAQRISGKFVNMLHLLHFLSPSTLSKQFHNALKGHASWLTCELCSTGVSLIRLYPSVDIVQSIFIEACSTLGYEERRVCSGVATLFGEEFVYILSHSKLSQTEICGLIISPSCMSVADNYPNEEKWLHMLLPLNASLERSLNSYTRKESILNTGTRLGANRNSNTSTILHLSDIHLDPYYEMNANAACNEPLCCRAGSSKSSHSFPAGFWGSFGNCDTNMHTIQNLIGTISRNYSDQYRYLMFTGDYIAHDVWNTTKEEIIAITRRLNTLFRENIPNGKVVIPVIGNHEGYPVDQFCPPSLGLEKFSAQWLYKELLDQWKDWIPEEYHQTFLENGYYSVVDGSARFIVLNMNYCARLNFWVAYDYVDLGGMLTWLQKELQKALAAKQYVYIAGHIAPDVEECVTHWVQSYNDILQKYSPIIKGQFFGHTHFDEVRLYYSSTNRTNAVSVAYLTPSVTTYCDVNPAFRLYHTDPQFGDIVDHRTYYLNLTEANRQHHNLVSLMWQPSQVSWQFEYSAREAYNLSSLSPQDWHEFMANINNNPESLRRYYRHLGRYDLNEVAKTSTATMLTMVRNRVFVHF